MADDFAHRAAAAARRRLGRLKRAALRSRSRTLARVRAPKRFVFVVSSGRSGSTLVQGLLNAMPGVLVRGENGFYLLGLFRAYRNALGFQRTYGGRSKETTSAFYGLGETDMGDFVRLTRTLMLRQLLGGANPLRVHVLGFKEVRWESIKPKEYEPFFAFFETVFPEARYVLNHRDPAVVADSGQWLRVDTDTALAELRRGIEVRDFLRRTRPERCYDTTFEVITGDDKSAVDAQLSGLADFVLGRSTETVLRDMRAVLSVGHGPYPFGKARRKPKPETAG